MPNTDRCPYFGDDAEFVYCKVRKYWNNYLFRITNDSIGCGSRQQLECSGQSGKCQDYDGLIGQLREDEYII